MTARRARPKMVVLSPRTVLDWSWRRVVQSVAIVGLVALSASTSACSVGDIDDEVTVASDATDQPAAGSATPPNTDAEGRSETAEVTSSSDASSTSRSPADEPQADASAANAIMTPEAAESAPVAPSESESGAGDDAAVSTVVPAESGLVFEDAPGATNEQAERPANAVAVEPLESSAGALAAGRAPELPRPGVEEGTAFELGGAVSDPAPSPTAAPASSAVADVTAEPVPTAESARSTDTESAPTTVPTVEPTPTPASTSTLAPTQSTSDSTSGQLVSLPEVTVVLADRLDESSIDVPAGVLDPDSRLRVLDGAQPGAVRVARGDLLLVDFAMYSWDSEALVQSTERDLGQSVWIWTGDEQPDLNVEIGTVPQILREAVVDAQVGSTLLVGFPVGTDGLSDAFDANEAYLVVIRVETALTPGQRG